MACQMNHYFSLSTSEARGALLFRLCSADDMSEVEEDQGVSGHDIEVSLDPPGAEGEDGR